jgi:hypothetical protein
MNSLFDTYDLIAKSGLFDAEYYAKANPDVVALNVDPLMHYVEQGAREGRNPHPKFDAAFYLEQCARNLERPENPLLHFVTVGRARGLRPQRVPADGATPAPQPADEGQSAQPAAQAVAVEPDIELVRRHFDAEYYREEYPDVAATRDDLLVHFFTAGWLEGRNPGAFFDTVSYLVQNPDVVKSGRNPLVHYLRYGKEEGRQATPSATPSVRTMLLFGVSHTDWVDRLRPHVDVEFYRKQLDVKLPKEVDLAAHFAYRGWREGKSPSAELTLGELSAKYPVAVRLLVNPLLAHVMVLAGTAGALGQTQERVPAEATRAIQATDGAAEASPTGAEALPASIDPNQLEAMREAFSPEYYLSLYKDVADAGVDPLLHYYAEGWREGRNPNRSFDTQYYLRSNEDVRAAGVHPFWHYLVAGRAEGRRPNPAGGFRRQIIEAAREPARRSEAYAKSAEEPIGDRALGKRIASWAKGRKGVIVSLSHDCYVTVVGGTQIVISDEQKIFNANGHGYLHLSPQSPLLTLAQEDAEFMVRIVLDGKLLGVAPLRSLREALRKNVTLPSEHRFLVAHCLLGFNPAQVCELWSALKPGRSFYWLHDFSSVCEGFNLLRNDVTFCSAPRSITMACRVCVYGAKRAEHLAGMRKVFEHCNFDVIAPSEVTLGLWKHVSDLPYKTARAHPHWALKAKRPERRQKASRRPGEAVKVAFVGFPSSTKGWQIFCELAAALEHDRRYELYHFVARGASSLPGVRVVPTEVLPGDREATIRLLKENHIDIVAMLAPWPETFSFVAHEAVVAGAYVVCMEASGNVAAMVRTTGRGVVLPSPEAVIEFFTSGAAATSGEIAKPAPLYTTIPSGATASIALPVSAKAQR